MLSDGDTLYFGHRQEPVVEDAGSSWATTHIDLEKVFHYEPVGIAEGLSSKERDLVLGIVSNMIHIFRFQKLEHYLMMYLDYVSFGCTPFLHGLAF